MELTVKDHHICLAILPLQNISEDTSIDMFCQGLVMDLITDLSRFRSFQLISYNSIKGLHPNEKLESDSLHHLELDYVVKGLVRYHQERLFFNIQLINARQNRLVWAEKFSGALDALLHIQEEIAEKIAGSLQHFVEHDQLSEIRKKPLTHLSAYECWLKGLHEIKQGTLEADEQARLYFQQAIEIDPHYARAYTGMSLTYFNEWSCQLWSRWEISQKGAFEWAQKAVALDELDHISTTILGRYYLFNAEYDKAEHYLRKALQLNPNDSGNLMLIASGLTFLGYAKEGQKLYFKAKRLNPLDSNNITGMFIHFELGQFDEAIAMGKKHQLGMGWVDFSAYMAAAYYLKGELSKVEPHWQDFLELFSIKINQGNPVNTPQALKWMIDVNPYKKDTQLKAFWEYMSQGDALPESPQPISPTIALAQFTHEAGLWTMAYAQQQAQLPDLKGFHDIARLLATPNEQIHCTDLMGGRLLEQGEQVFDEQAKTAYQKRILAIQNELAEAEALQHHERLTALHQEYDQLLDHLQKATGLNGKMRKLSDSVEKARSAVTWRIRSAIKKMADVHPDLSKHLKTAIKTGVFCEYAPEHDIAWKL